MIMMIMTMMMMMMMMMMLMMVITTLRVNRCTRCTRTPTATRPQADLQRKIQTRLLRRTKEECVHPFRPFAVLSVGVVVVVVLLFD